MTRLLSALLIALLLSSSLVHAPATHAENDYSRVMALAATLDTAVDALPPETSPVLTSVSDLTHWETEIVPYFAVEGIDDLQAKPGTLGAPVYPDAVFTNYPDPFEFFHVLGTTLISGQDIDLNARYTRPESPLYARPDAVFVLIHELCHAQGIQWGYDGWEQHYNVETSAQLCALETAAAMVDTGNHQLLAPLLGELRSMALDAGFSLALRDGTLPRYRADLARLADPWELAAYDRALRWWTATDLTQLGQILNDYNYQPVMAVLTAVAGDQTIPGVLLPINWLADLANHPYVYDANGYQQGPVEPVTRQPVLPLVIDDLAYVIAHATELAR